jgi:radical SAM protein with 4Fe4S-binding SPASM domain
MKWGLFIQLADEAEKMQPEMVSLHASGEPLLHPEITKMVEELAKRDLATEIVTNGDFLTPELSLKLRDAGLKRLVISHPAITSENWQACRDEIFFSHVDERIEEAVKIWQGSEDLVTIRCLVFPDKVKRKGINTREFLKKWLDLPGVRNVEFWSYQPWPEHVLEEEIHSIDLHPKTCSVALQTIFVSWDGKISPCSLDIHGKLALGTFPNNSLVDLYNAKVLRKFRKQIVSKSQKRPAICKGCLITRTLPVLVDVQTAEYQQIDPSMREDWIKAKGRECWLQLVRKESRRAKPVSKNSASFPSENKREDNGIS